jgi:hypothetical protein
MGDLKPFDPADFQKTVADKIKAEFAGLIPEEHWKSLVKKHVDDFLNGTGEGTLHAIVFREMGVKLAELLKTYFTTDGWSATWQGDGRHVASERIRHIITENMPTIVADLLSGAAQQTLENMRQRIGVNRSW